MIGIYKIENLVNHKVYIGQSVDIEQRWWEHKNLLKKNLHISRHLQNSWNKYGEQNFSFEVLELCEKEELTSKEQFWINFYGGLNSKRTYNSRDAGNSGTFSKEARQKQRLAHLGKNKGQPIPWLQDFDRSNEEYRKNLSKSLKGKKKSALHAQHISEGRKGIVFSEEQKRKIGDSKRGVSTSLKGRKKYEKDGIVKWVRPEEFEFYIKQGWKEYHRFYAGEDYVRGDPWNKGIPCSKETKQKLRDFNLGKKLSEETKRKMGESRKGMIYVNDGVKNVRIHKEELEKYLNEGWLVGGKKRK